MCLFYPRRFFSSLVFLFLILLSGCTESGGSDEIGEAYVAPATLNLRREIAQKSSNVAVLKHGERVSIIDVRRRFVKIRTKNKQEGWVDSLQLLSSAQMEALRGAALVARAMPSEGSATVFEALNIHTEPNRQSPAFARIEEGVYVTVLAHRLSPKLTESLTAPNLIKERPTPTSRRGRRAKAARTSMLPPPPGPPKAPANWRELSAEHFAASESPAQAKKRQQQAAAEAKLAEQRKPIALEDWTLVRTKDGESGWVLTRNLVMGIPDEVAQYAEGRRITSYFDLGIVDDEEKGPKHNWLWTTASGQITYDFDAWRVFLWNRHRHRYETSYRQRDVEGYFPVVLDPVAANVYGRSFRLVTKDEDGKFRKRSYIFDSTRVHLISTEDSTPNGTPLNTSAKSLDTGRLEGKKPAGSNWFSRQMQALRSHFSGQAGKR